MIIFTIFLAKLLSPGLIAIGIIGAFLSRTWWHIAITAVVAAIFNEALLSATQFTRSFNPIVFFVGIMAAGVWAALAFWVKKIRQKK